MSETISKASSIKTEVTSFNLRGIPAPVWRAHIWTSKGYSTVTRTTFQEATAWCVRRRLIAEREVTA